MARNSNLAWILGPRNDVSHLEIRRNWRMLPSVRSRWCRKQRDFTLKHVATKISFKNNFQIEIEEFDTHLSPPPPLIPIVNNHSISGAWTKRFNLSPYFFTHLRNNQTFGGFNFETFIIFIGMKKIIRRNCTRIESRGSLTESRCTTRSGH